MYLLFTAFVAVGLSACSHNELSKKNSDLPRSVGNYPLGAGTKHKR